MTNAEWWSGVRARRADDGKTGLPTDRLWTLTKDGHAITATLALVPSYGRELRLTRDGQFWRSRMFRDGLAEIDTLFDLAVHMRAELEARGWAE
jgi:hypothetical protein